MFRAASSDVCLRCTAGVPESGGGEERQGARVLLWFSSSGQNHQGPV